MASNLVIPDVLKQIKPYMTLGDQLEQKGDRTAAYYCIAIIIIFFYFSFLIGILKIL